LFFYSELKILSAAPLKDIKAYLHELGGEEKSELTYEYPGLQIEIIIGTNEALKNLNMPQHTINVQGEKILAEKFLTEFRFRFLSAGG
jgi:hypothetical protein